MLNARHLKPPEVHRGTLSEKMGRASRLRAKSNINMTRSLHTTGISIYETKFNIIITRSQKNLDWVKSKFASLKANIHTQVNKSLLQQMIAATKFQQLFAATKKTFTFFRESRSTQQTHRTRRTPMSAFDLCQTQGFKIENNSPQAFEISLLLGSVTLQSTEPKLSGERCSPFSTRLSTCE